MHLPKYRILNHYTFEELRREYTRIDVKSRIALLKSLYDNDSMSNVPFEVARLAVNDHQVEVREWIALNGRWLDYSERSYGSDDDAILFPDRNLENQLKNDPDLFVRARLRENPSAWNRFAVLDEFKTASPLERLAMMHNHELSGPHEAAFLKKLFDHQDEDLSITFEERKELIGAFLSNQQAIAKIIDPNLSYDCHFTSILWELAAKWPHSSDSDVRRTNRPILMPHYVYLYLPVDDKTKANIYQREQDSISRCWILESCGHDDVQTLELGKRDKDKQCRELARQASIKPSPSDQEYGEILKREMAERAKYRQDVMTFLTRLGIALIFVKLYFSEWSNLALSVSIGLSGTLLAIYILDHVP